MVTSSSARTASQSPATSERAAGPVSVSTGGVVGSTYGMTAADPRLIGARRPSGNRPARPGLRRCQAMRSSTTGDGVKDVPGAAMSQEPSTAWSA